MIIGVGIAISSYDQARLAGRRPSLREGGAGGWVHNVDLFSILLRCRETVFVKVSSWWHEWEPSRLLLVPSPQVLAYYSNIVSSGSACDCNHSWWISTSESLNFLGISFVAFSRNDVLLFKTADPRILSNLYGVLTPLHSCLVGTLEKFGFYEIVRGTKLGPVLPYLVFRGSLEVDWEHTCLAMENSLCTITRLMGRHLVSLIN